MVPFKKVEVRSVLDLDIASTDLALTGDAVTLDFERNHVISQMERPIEAINVGHVRNFRVVDYDR